MLAKILNMSTGRCWSSDTYNPYPGVFDGVPSSNDYQGGFGSQLMAKVCTIVYFFKYFIQFCSPVEPHIVAIIRLWLSS